MSNVKLNLSFYLQYISKSDIFPQYITKFSIFAAANIVSQKQKWAQHLSHLTLTPWQRKPCAEVKQNMWKCLK